MNGARCRAATFQFFAEARRASVVSDAHRPTALPGLQQPRCGLNSDQKPFQDRPYGTKEISPVLIVLWPRFRGQPVGLKPLTQAAPWRLSLVHPCSTYSPVMPERD